MFFSYKSEKIFKKSQTELFEGMGKNTQFDRSGDNYNKDVYDIEKYGMELADKVIAVSYYTKSIIVNKYGINPDKIEVVHNAINKKRLLEQLHIHNNLNSKIVLFLGVLQCKKARIIL